MGNSREARLRTWDWILLGTLLPVFGLTFGLHVQRVVDGLATPPGVLTHVESSDTYPEVIGLNAELPQASELEPGDRLIRVGDTDLRGALPAQFLAAAVDAARGRSEAPLVYERDGERVASTYVVTTFPLPWARLPFLLAFVGLAVIVLLRSPGSSHSRLCFAAFITFAVFQGAFWGGSGTQTLVAVFVFYTAGAASLVLIARWMIGFPPDGDPSTRLSTRWSWLFGAVWLSTRVAYELSVPLPVWLVLLPPFFVDMLLISGYVGILTWNYMSATAVGRRRIRWMLLGCYLAAAPWLVIFGISFFAGPVPWLTYLHSLGLLSVVFAPLGLLFAIARYNLFDIDVLISRAATLSLLGIVLLGGVLGLLPSVARAASDAAGISSTSAQLMLSLGFAAVLIPVNRRVRPWVEGMMFAERQEIGRGVERLIVQLGECPDAPGVFALAGQRVAELLQPESCLIYAGGDPAYVPVYHDGPQPSPGFAPDSLLVAALRERGEPLVVEAAGRRSDRRPLGPFDRAALETLQAAAVIPIRRGARLRAFLCLGAKRSSDVYTSTDLALLVAVADKIATELLRFDDAEALRREREMAESLRRYVPGAVVSELASGRELEAGEREVSILFVDLRGYTTQAEGRRATDVFSTVNHYTEAVSTIVQRHGGSVVDFQGDGMMAVFGAPNALPHKERAALDAGREIAATVESMSFEGASTGVDGSLSVGVGIATGDAFVGNIQAADRMIWSAIGNTTNLAARLQNLTRDLNAAIVVDAATCDGAGRPREFVRHADVSIRGRKGREDVYLVPLG